MRILVVSSFLLFAETRFGGAKRLYSMVRELSRRHEVDVVCFDGCGEGQQRTGAAFTLLPRSLVLNSPAGNAGLRRLTHAPVDVRVDRNQLESFLGNRAFDGALYAYPLALSALTARWVRRVSRVVYLEDDFWTEQLRHQAAQASRVAPRLLKRVRLAQALRLYRRKVRLIDAAVAITGQEARIGARLLPGVPFHIVKYGVELADCPVQPPRNARERPVLGFIGNFRHTPNADAVRWLLERVVPALHGSMPEVRLLLAGRHLLEQGLPPAPQVDFVDDVADLADFYARIDVFVNPIVSGRGLRTKVVEAAAFGRPIVSTTLGAEGLEELRMETADEPGPFASACCRLLADRERMAQDARANRQAVEREYSLPSVTRRLELALRGST